MSVISHCSYQEYLVDGENYMRVKFYLKGSKRKGTVHVDVKQVLIVTQNRERHLVHNVGQKYLLNNPCNI